MAGVDTESGRGRALNREVQMIPFIDLLMVTVAFLLITAVWATHSRLNANAQVPGKERGDDIGTPTRVLHLYAEDDGFTLTWRQGDSVLSETRVPREQSAPDGLRYPSLAGRIAEEWKLHGSHQDPNDPVQDRCVVHTDDRVPFSEIVATMDAIYDAKRELRIASGRRLVPAFNMVFAAR